MKNYINNILVVFTLIVTSIFLGLGTVKAIDTITIDKVKSYNGVNIRTTTNGKYAYSIGSPKVGPKKGDKLSLSATYKKGFYLYILNDSKISGSNSNVSRTIKQKAIWKIRGYKIRGSYVNEANKLVSAAKSAGAEYEINPSISYLTSPGILNKSGSYYVSDKINVEMKNVTGNSFDVSFKGAPSGTEVYNKTNSSFQIRVPVSSVKNNMAFRIKVSGSISTYKYVKQYHKDSDTDDVAVLYLSSKVPSKEVSARIILDDSTSNSNSVSTSSEDTHDVTLFIVSGKTNNTLKVKDGQKLQKPVDPIRKGYKFVGWYTDDTYQIKYNFNNPVNNDLELYARWELKTYNINFNSNGGSKVKTVKALYNQSITKPEDPTKSGYIFAGWYKDSSFENKFSFLTSISSDLTLYAKWVTEKPNTHDVTFVGGFDIDPIIIEVKDNETVSAPLVTNSLSDKLDGWYTDTSKQDKFDFSTPINKDLVLYAKWLAEDGSELIATPDTASPARVIIVIAGIVLFIGGGYVFYRQYGFNLKRF